MLAVRMHQSLIQTELMEEVSNLSGRVNADTPKLGRVNKYGN